MSEQSKEWTGVWIPKSIWLNEELGWTEKMLLVEIKSLDNEQGCFAGNKHFAEFFKLSKDRISKMVTELKRMDYIDVKLVYKPGTKQIEKRIIKVNILKYEGVGENTDRYGRKKLEAIGENTDTPIGENAEDNNTSINNTINNTINIKQEKELAKAEKLRLEKEKDIEMKMDFEDLWKEYPKKVGKKDAFNKYKEIINEGDYTHEDIMNGVLLYKDFVIATKTEYKFIKHPKTYLNQESFTDELVIPSNNQFNNQIELKPWEVAAYGQEPSRASYDDDRSILQQPLKIEQPKFNI